MLSRRGFLGSAAGGAVAAAVPLGAFVSAYPPLLAVTPAALVPPMVPGMTFVGPGVAIYSKWTFRIEGEAGRRGAEQ